MGPFIHRKKTKEWAIELGIPADAAEVIAIANAMVDNDAERYPRESYHMRPFFFGKDRRAETVERHLHQALEAARQGQCDSAWNEIGQGLHVVQDLVAHGNAHIHHKWMDYVEFTAGKPDPEQKRLLELERVSKEYLTRALAEPSILRCLSDSPGRSH
jgi:hypothetical protein